jgi:hypothetical protein
VFPERETRHAFPHEFGAIRTSLHWQAQIAIAPGLARATRLRSENRAKRIVARRRQCSLICANVAAILRNFE